MKEKYFSYKYLISIIILFMCLFLFSATSLALIPGDFGSAEGPTPDGVVDFEDLMIFALAYGSTSADDNWNPDCDIASLGSTIPDGVIDFEDLMIFALHYGECAPPSAPTLSDPGTTLLSPAAYMVSWSAVSGATSYVLQEAASSDFTSGLQEYPLTDISKDFSHTVSTTTIYYYRVAAVNDYGQSGWSNVEDIDIVSTYNVGDIGPAGGLIFYDKGSVSDGWRYLEAAPASTEWAKEWGSHGTLIGGTETGIGTGQSNTTIIVTWLDNNTDDTQGDVTNKTDRAAYLCDELTEGGYNDWFLPSKDELNLMYENLHEEGVGGFAAEDYWSSSEGTAFYAWVQRFDDGSQHYYSKYDSLRVRAVRAFRSTAPTYMVNYNANGATAGTVPSDGYHYEPGESVTVLGNTGNLVKTGYTFDGWNTQADGNGTDRAVGSTFSMGSENVTLYAQWTINTYTVTFDSQGGTAVVSQTVDHDGKATEPTAPTKTGHTFGGWYKESGCTNVWDFTTDTVTADVILFAKWTANNYTITFDKNDAEATGTMAAQTIASGSTANLTACGFTKTGWAFDGWATTSGGAVVYADGASYTMGTANVTLYAKWTTYSLRDEGPAGGLIFYINPNYATDGWRYLEAAPSSTEWSVIQWGSYQKLIGGTETGIGTGESNTNIIVTWLNAHFQDNRAAEYCFDLSIENNLEIYDDWFLPSKEELNLVYTNLKVAGVGGFAFYYWSSSEYNAYNAWNQDFDYGGQYDNYKFSTYRVRAIRAF